MPRQCQFPVQFSDNRRCYRASTAPGFVISLALVAALAGYVGVSYAAPAIQETTASPSGASQTYSIHAGGPTR